MKITFRLWVLIICILLALLMISPSFTNGIIVKSIEKNSTAFQEGLRNGMIIKELNSKEINSYEDYTKSILDGVKVGDLTKYEIKTDQGDFIFLEQGAPKITVDNIPKTKIKTGLDLSGGARAIVRPIDVELTQTQLNDLVSVTDQRFNAFGISDVNIRSVSDLEGNKFMLVEVAGITPADLRELVSKQGKFEAKIGNKTIFIGGDRDISDVCRNDATCAGVTGCFPTQEGNGCNFQFVIYLSEEAADRHAEVTKDISLDETGQYLSEKLTLYIDDTEVDSLLISSSLRGQKTTQVSIQGSGSGSTSEDALKDAKESMNRLQTILITGSLPYKLEILKLDTISPSLGKEFSRSIILLGLTVFLIVSISIFVRYRKIKLTLAVILTMFSEAIITLGIAAFIRWNLDAPAIAGIIAGIGTGVNDQIVIIDESLSKSDNSNIKSRVKRALFIILGAFFTIVAAMLPLFWAGAGLFRGFALTTILGVTVGILITRPAFADIIRQVGE
ncbi:MAG: hypothetical protein AABX83_01265 [Nanoarchaeota archaeon]